MMMEARYPYEAPVTAYGNGGFRIGGARHTGSLLVFADVTLPWTARLPADVDPSALRAAVQARSSPVRILVIGCGAAPADPPADLTSALREIGVGVLGRGWRAGGAGRPLLPPHRSAVQGLRRGRPPRVRLPWLDL